MGDWHRCQLKRLRGLTIRQMLAFEKSPGALLWAAMHGGCSTHLQVQLLPDLGDLLGMPVLVRRWQPEQVGGGLLVRFDLVLLLAHGDGLAVQAPTVVKQCRCVSC